MFGSRVLTDIEAAEERLKVVLPIDVVVMLQHVHGERLAEAARTDVEEILVGFFHVPDEGSLIYIVAVFLDDILKILHSVRDALAIDSLFSLSDCHSAIFIYCKATTFICNLQIFRRKNERNLQRWTYDSLSPHKKEPWRFPISSCCFLFILFVVYHFFA